MYKLLIGKFGSRWIALVCVMALSWGVATVNAATEPQSAAVESERVENTEVSMTQPAIYIQIRPAFVVNYGGKGRLKYIKADVAVRLDNAEAANSVRHHMPYIRNNLVMLLSAQTDESIASQEGKEALRQEALQVVRDIIEQEDQVGGVVDLYFNSFLIQ